MGSPKRETEAGKHHRCHGHAAAVAMALALTAVSAAEAFTQAIAISTQASDPTAEVKETVT
jgi:hypothetical protein